MIATNDILLTKPYALSRVNFLRQFYSLAKERLIKNSPYNLSDDYETILGFLKASKQAIQTSSQRHAGVSSNH